jgi:molecular chaperone GrpE
MSGAEEETNAEVPIEEVPIEEEETGRVEESKEPESYELNPAKEIEGLLAEVESLRDQALRAEAEMQNVRRRAERDVENAHKFGLERLVQHILPVVDSLEKALEAKTSEDDPVIEGVKLTFKLLQDLLTKESIQVVDPLGEPFDPNLHEAMSIVENPDMEENSVFAVVQKGYTLNERLVRPAMVMVTKTPDDKENP